MGFSTEIFLPSIFTVYSSMLSSSISSDLVGNALSLVSNDLVLLKMFKGLIDLRPGKL